MEKADSLAMAFCDAITCGTDDDSDRRRIILEALGENYKDPCRWQCFSTADLCALFNNNSAENGSVVWHTDDQWRWFFREPRGIDEHFRLEAYIARYIKALNMIGLNTYWSCDGNHQEPRKRNRMEIGFSERLSRLWHDTLCRYHPAFQNGLVWTHNENKSSHPNMSVCRFNSRNQLDTYLRINKTAERIEEERTGLLALKKELTDILHCHGDLSCVSNETIISIMTKAVPDSAKISRI